MNDLHDTTSDAAARAIREALPTPDEQAIERIAARIGAGAPTPAPSPAPASTARPARRAHSRSLIRPALAAGAVATAAAVALLAPGSDDSSSRPGLLALGPDAAAADVLRAVGDEAARAGEWHPLAAGEYHHTRIVEPGAWGRSNVTTEEWLAADGSVHVRVTDELTNVPEGERFYVPALKCPGPNTVGSPSSQVPGPPGDIETLPAGSTAPDCWKQLTNNAILASVDGGRVVAQPPAGALLEVPGGPGLDSRPLRFGTEVYEGTARLDVPPGASSQSTTATTRRVEFTPFQLSPETTWIAVEARPYIRSDRTFRKGKQARFVAPVVTRSLWASTFTPYELKRLPTDGDGMLAKLEYKATTTPAGTYELDDAAAPGSVEIPSMTVEQVQLALALDLLTHAPISPDVRAATFEALGQLEMDGRSATVDRDATFADGSDAIAVVFPISPPPGYGLPENEDDTTRMLFDPKTAAFRETVMELGDEQYVTTYDEPRRVTEIPPVK
jgi:hypothetical protein